VRGNWLSPCRIRHISLRPRVFRGLNIPSDETA
jgi:hypothetical protein